MFGGILVFSFSRVLLAVSKRTAPAIGLLMALNILVAAALVAYGGRVRRRPVSFPLLTVGAIAVVAVGLAAMGLQPPRERAVAQGPPGVRIALTAKGIAFDKSSLSFPAGSKVTIVFTNDDAGTTHNVDIFSESNPSNPVFRGQVFAGVATMDYTFTAPAKPGMYAFHCDIHPTQMKGTVTVTAAGAPPGGPAGGTAQVVAKGIAYQPTKLSVPGGGQVRISFENQDAGIPHNIHVFKGTDASAPTLFTGQIVTGPTTTVYTFPAPAPGTYFFHCDVHPTQMMGTLTVT